MADETLVAGIAGAAGLGLGLLLGKRHDQYAVYVSSTRETSPVAEMLRFSGIETKVDAPAWVGKGFSDASVVVVPWSERAKAAGLIRQYLEEKGII